MILGFFSYRKEKSMPKWRKRWKLENIDNSQKSTKHNGLNGCNDILSIRYHNQCPVCYESRKDSNATLIYVYVYSGDMQLTVWCFFNVSFMYIYIIKDMAITTESCDVAPFLQLCRECDNYDFSLHTGMNFTCVNLWFVHIISFLHKKAPENKSLLYSSLNLPPPPPFFTVFSLQEKTNILKELKKNNIYVYT